MELEGCSVAEYVRGCAVQLEVLEPTQPLISNGPSMTPSLPLVPGLRAGLISSQTDPGDLKCLDSKRSPFDFIVLLKLTYSIFQQHETAYFTNQESDPSISKVLSLSRIHSEMSRQAF
jgi:hypothetical protein